MKRALLLALLAACGDEVIPAAERGRELASDPSLSTRADNELACTTCHAVGAGDGRLLPGYPLGGAVARPSYWGGAYLDLRSAVDFCLTHFMRGEPLDPASEEARALWEFLRSIENDGPREALPFTLQVRTLGFRARGDRARGAELHRRACGECHGSASAPTGVIGDSPGLPEQAVAEARELFPEFDPGDVFVEKIRHGSFFLVGGTMPPFSLEALSDEQLADLLAFYGL